MNRQRIFMSENDLVTVVVPAYNAQQFLKENVESIKNQSYKNLEIIYVCDGCTDRTVEILQGFVEEDSRIILQIENENHGAAISRNIGMSLAKGEWIIFLDADDLFDSQMIETMLETSAKEQADIVICYSEYFDDVPNKNALIYNDMKKWYCKTYPIVETEKELCRLMQIVDTIPCTKLIHKSIYKKKEIFFQNIPNANDIYFSMVAAINSNKIVYIDQVFFHYRSNKGRYTLSTERNSKKNYVFEACNKIYEYLKNKNNNENILKSFYNNVFYCLFVYLDYEVYESLFSDLRNTYMDMWEMNRQGIRSQLNCINSILYDKVLNNNMKGDKKRLFMDARVECVRRLSTEGCSIWGAGLLGKNLLEEIFKTDIKIQHVYDSSQNNWGKIICGHIVEKLGDNYEDNIIVSTSKYFNEIREQIGSKAKKLYDLEKQIWMIPCEDDTYESEL